MDGKQLTTQSSKLLVEIRKNIITQEAYKAANPEELRRERRNIEEETARIHEWLWKIVNGVGDWGMSQAVSPLVIVARDRSTASGPFSVVGEITSVGPNERTEQYASIRFGVVRDDNNPSHGDQVWGKVLADHDYLGYGKWSATESTQGIHAFDDQASQTSEEVLARYARLASMSQSLGLILEAAQDVTLNPRAGRAIAG